ncbi:nucleotidyltransferase family protein [Solibacillus silvestris]|uniref:nucleotidyltransferase family protein n=1 Tax=Solibacillus silvestris TaxID=76853 RepID=UPI003F7FE7DE
MNLEMKLINLITSDPYLFSILKTVEKLELNDCWIAAGIIRNKVWDNMHNTQTEVNDIDVIFYDNENISIHTEKEFESILKDLMPNEPWSVKNQARMHINNKALPYHSSFDGVAHFPETPTAIAARINNNTVEIMAPYGLQDLFEGRVKPTPPFKKNSNLHSIYLNRIQNKKWDILWDKLVFECE